MDENGELRATLNRIEQSQADMLHEVVRLRADMALLASRQNSKITDTKKKLTALPNLSRHLLPGYSN